MLGTTEEIINLASDYIISPFQFQMIRRRVKPDMARSLNSQKITKIRCFSILINYLSVWKQATRLVHADVAVAEEPPHLVGQIFIVGVFVDGRVRFGLEQVRQERTRFDTRNVVPVLLTCVHKLFHSRNIHFQQSSSSSS